MANSYRQSRSPVRAVSFVNPLGGTAPQLPYWGEADPWDPAAASLLAARATADAGAPATTCPECGTQLQLELHLVSAHVVRSHTPEPQLRAAPEPEQLPDFDESVNDYKRDLIGRALDENGGVMTRAAKALGLKYTTFVAMAHRLGVVDRGNGKDADQD